MTLPKNGPNAEARDWLFERFVQVPNELPRVMSIELAYFLSFLDNWSKLRADARNDWWFYCPFKRIQEKLRIHRQKQWRMLKALQEKGFLEFRRIVAQGDKKGRRWIKIDYEAIRKAIFEEQDREFRQQLVESQEEEDNEDDDYDE